MKLKISRLLVLAVISLSLNSCDSHGSLARKYFNSNIADYGIFSQMGVDALMTMAEKVDDSKFEAFTKGASKNCPRKEFLEYVEDAHRSFNKAASGIILKEIEKEFTDEELKEMTKFYSGFYSEEVKDKIKAMFVSADLPTAISYVGASFSQDKVKEYVAYKNTPLGYKEAVFTSNLPDVLEKYTDELKKASRPEKPACLK
jgi:hypothetical protein